MPQPMTLAVVGALTLVGAGVGTWAGRAAIAEINPAYFNRSDDSFHADRVPYRSPGWAETDTGVREDVQLAHGLGNGCLTCGAPEMAAAAPVMPAVYGEQWVQDASAAAEPAAILFVEAEPDPERERVQRYASYPVSAEEAEAARQPEPAPEEEFASTEPEGL
jgi:hypothetical protein